MSYEKQRNLWLNFFPDSPRVQQMTQNLPPIEDILALVLHSGTNEP